MDLNTASVIIGLFITFLLYKCFSSHINVIDTFVDFFDYVGGKDIELSRVDPEFLPLVGGVLIIAVLCELAATTVVALLVGMPASNLTAQEFILSFVLVPPVILLEEVVFRVLLVGLLNREKYQNTMRVLIAGVLFAIYHHSNYNYAQSLDYLRLAPYIVMHYVFTYAYIKGGLKASFTVHFFFDIVAVITLLIPNLFGITK